MLSGYLLSVHSLLPHLIAVGWFPLVLLFFIKHYETGKNKHLVLSGIFLAIEFFAGAPEMVILTLFVLFVISVYPRPFIYTNSPEWWNRLKPFFVIIILFCLISAIQAIPFYELKIQSIRSVGLPYSEATTWSFSWRDFVLFFLPDAFGYWQTEAKYWANQSWLKTVYLGIIPFVMSLFFFCTKDKKRLVFLGFMILSLLLSLGGNTPLYQFLYKIPPFNAIRYPVKFLFLFFFIIAITSALGFDKLRSSFVENNKKIKIIVIVFFYVGFIFAGLWGYLNIFSDNVQAFLEVHNFKPDYYNEIWFNLHNLKRFFLFSFLFCVMLLLYLRSRNKYAMYAIMFILIADLFLANYSYYRAVPCQEIFSQEHKFAKSFLQFNNTERYFVTNRTHADLGRFFPTDRAILHTPYAPLLGLYTIGGVEIMRIAHHDQFLNLLLGAATLNDAKRFINIAGIRFIITSYRIDDADFKLREQLELGDKKAYLYEYIHYINRFLLFNKIHYVNNDQELGKKLLDKNIDLRKELIVVSKGKFQDVQVAPLVGQVKLLSYSANKVELEANCNTNAFLYLSDTYYPGWRAYVDGKRTEIYRANLAFRAIQVPTGRHTVVFKYVPMSFYAGLVLTVLGIILCIWLWRRDRKRPEGPKIGEGPEKTG